MLLLEDENDIGLYEKCFSAAELMTRNGMILGTTDVEEVAELLFKTELEKKEKDIISDSKIEYNDEIIEIEAMGDLETIDISVTGDNLFYASNILTKNSYGLPMVADFMGAIIQNEELFKANKYLFKVIKSRFDDNINKIYTIGVDRKRMKLTNLDPSEQEIPIHLKDQLAVQTQQLNKKKNEALFDFDDEY